MNDPQTTKIETTKRLIIAIIALTGMLAGAV